MFCTVGILLTMGSAAYTKVSWATFLQIAFILIVLASDSYAAKNYLFKTCAQSSFCRRARKYADGMQNHGRLGSSYAIDSSTVTFKNGILSGNILKDALSSSGELFKVELPFQLSLLASGSARFTVDEKQRSTQNLAFPTNVRQRRYDESAKWAITGDLSPDLSAEDITTSDEKTQGIYRFRYGQNWEVNVETSPLQIKFVRDEEIHVVLNDRGLFNMEHWRKKPEGDVGSDPAFSNEVDTEGMWSESFGGKLDSKPKGTCS